MKDAPTTDLGFFVLLVVALPLGVYAVDRVLCLLVACATHC